MTRWHSVQTLGSSAQLANLRPFASPRTPTYGTRPFLHAELQVNKKAPKGNGHLSQSHSSLTLTLLSLNSSVIQSSGPSLQGFNFHPRSQHLPAKLVQSTHWIDKGSSSYILPKICPSGTLTRLLESALGAVWRVLAVLRWLCLLEARLPHFSIFLTILLCVRGQPWLSVFLVKWAALLRGRELVLIFLAVNRLNPRPLAFPSFTCLLVKPHSFLRPCS